VALATSLYHGTSLLLLLQLSLRSFISSRCTSFIFSLLLTMSRPAVDPLASFPKATLTPVVGKPTFASLAVLRQELTSNASSVFSPRGNGTLGHAVLVLGVAEYNARSNTPWVDPPNPGPAPVIPNNATQFQIQSITSAWERGTREWETFNMVEKALKRQLLEAVDDSYISSLKDPLFLYSNVTVFQLMEHLRNTYADLDQDLLTKNQDLLKEPWMPSETLEPLWERGVQAQAVAQAGGDPISDTHLIREFRNLFKNIQIISL